MRLIRPATVRVDQVHGTVDVDDTTMTRAPSTPPSSLSDDRCRHRRDSGFSLVEVLVSILILGIVGSGVLMTVGASARAGRVHRDQAEAQLVLLSAADVVQGRAPVDCAAAAATYQSEVRARMQSLGLDGGWSTSKLSVTDVQSWNPATSTFASGCTSSASVHKVTLSLVPNGGGAAKVLEVLTGSGAATVPIGAPHVFTTEWSIISEGDVTISGTQVYGGLAVGGDLRFTTSGPIAANSQGTYGPVLGTTTTVGLLVNGRIVLTAGTLLINQGASVVVGDMSGQKYQPNGGVGCIVAAASASCVDPKVTLQGTGNAVAGRPFDFSGAFDAYRKISTAMSTLLPGCANAVAVTLRDQNNTGAWPGNTNFHLRLTANRVNVWNMTESQLQSWSGFNNNGTDRPSATNPLVINVTTADGNVTFNAPNWLQSDAARFVFWNFPDASTVTFSNALWGSLYAPFSTVTLTSDVRGVVVAKHVVAAGGVADWDRRPGVDIDCPRPA